MNTLKLDLNTLSLSPDIIAVLLDHNVFEGVLHDGVCVEDVLAELDSHLLVQVGVNGEFAGFFSLEDLGTFAGKRCVEVHAYLLPHMRKYSLMLLGQFRDFIFGTTSFDVIMTSAYSNLRHVHLLLKRVGFTDFTEREDVTTFNGVSVNQKHYYLNKTED